MNLQQMAQKLLQRLELPEGAANVVVSTERKPETLIVLVHKGFPKGNSLDVWEGHPVQILYTGCPPLLQ